MKNKGKIILVTGVVCLIAGAVILAFCFRSRPPEVPDEGGSDPERADIIETEVNEPGPDDINAPENPSADVQGQTGSGEQGTDLSQEEEITEEPSVEDIYTGTGDTGTVTPSVPGQTVSQESSSGSSQQGGNETESSAEEAAGARPEEDQTPNGSADIEHEQSNEPASETSGDTEDTDTENTEAADTEDITLPETVIPAEENETEGVGTPADTDDNTEPGQENEVLDDSRTSASGEEGDITLPEIDITWTPANPQGTEDSGSQESSGGSGSEDSGDPQPNEGPDVSGNTGSGSGEAITLPEIEIPDDPGNTGSGDDSDNGHQAQQGNEDTGSEQNTGSGITVSDDGDVVLPEVP